MHRGHTGHRAHRAHQGPVGSRTSPLLQPAGTDQWAGPDPPCHIPRGLVQMCSPSNAPVPGDHTRVWAHRICTQSCCKVPGGLLVSCCPRHSHRKQHLHPQPKNISMPSPSRTAGWKQHTCRTRAGASGVVVGGSSHSCSPLQAVRRAVGVSQQQFLSLKERGRGSSPVPAWAPPLITEEDEAQLGASEHHSSEDSHTPGPFLQQHSYLRAGGQRQSSP